MANTKVKENEPRLTVVGQILEHTRLQPADEGYDVAQLGVELLLQEIFKKDEAVQRVDKRLIDQMIDELDVRLGKQVDEILHNLEFQELEATWRSLQFFVKRTAFNENIKVEIVNVSKEDLLADFQDAPNLNQAGIYRHAYTSEYGQFGGQPYGVIIGDYQFGPGAKDVQLLEYMASMGAMIHAPFIGGASNEFFGIGDFDELLHVKEVNAIFDGPQFKKWRSFRESEDARNVGLALPRFLLRQPYGVENCCREFNYKEENSGAKENYLWGNASFAFGTRISESFAQYRWCPNIVGPQSGGTVRDMVVDQFEEDGQDCQFGPAEIPISDRREYELSELGFIPLTLRKGSDDAAFFSANSVQKPKFFGADSEAKQAEVNYRLGTQLPYLFIINRLAHYIKVLQRENLGSWKSRGELESELNKWLRQYVSDQESPSSATRSQRPLRKANINVNEVEGESGWYSVEMEVTPHFKYMGSNFTLYLTGTLDRV